MNRTPIEWTDATWNPVRGCSRVSEGCRNCYAERIAGRFSGPGLAYEGLAKNTKSGPRWTGRVQLVERHLEDPLHWRDGRRIFVNSMSDLFHEALSDEQIDRVFAVMALSPQHTFQVLTKRPERMLEYVTGGRRRIVEAAHDLGGEHRWSEVELVWPLPHVWLGVSAEDQATAEERIPFLGQTPAVVRFVSAEPLLGPIDFGNAFDPPTDDSDYQPLNWVIVGGESGPGARPTDLGWVHSIVEQCQFAGVAVFVKQLGAVPMMDEDVWHVAPLTRLLSTRNRKRVPSGFVPIQLHDSKGGNWDTWPAELRVREFPKLVAA